MQKRGRKKPEAAEAAEGAAPAEAGKKVLRNPSVDGFSAIGRMHPVGARHETGTRGVDQQTSQRYGAFEAAEDSPKKRGRKKPEADPEAEMGA